MVCCSRSLKRSWVCEEASPEHSAQQAGRRLQHTILTLPTSLLGTEQRGESSTSVLSCTFIELCAPVDGALPVFDASAFVALWRSDSSSGQDLRCNDQGSCRNFNPPVPVKKHASDKLLFRILCYQKTDARRRFLEGTADIFYSLCPPLHGSSLHWRGSRPGRSGASRRDGHFCSLKKVRWAVP